MANDGTGPDTSQGFWRWVKSPRLCRTAERQRADEEAALAAFDPDRATPAQIGRLVAGLLNQELCWPATAYFDKLGRRAVPAMVRALSDGRFFRPYRGKSPRTLPVKAVLRLLGDLAPQEATARVVELAAYPDQVVRTAAVGVLGQLASAAALPAWLAASREPDPEVRRAAVWGVASAVTAGRVAPAFAAAAMDRLAELLDDAGDSSIVQGAAEALVRLDPDRGRAELTGPTRFTPDNPRLLELLIGADEHECPLPPGRVAELLTRLRPTAEDYFHGRGIGLLLDQLARQDDPGVGGWAESVVGWAAPGSDGGREIGRAAARVLARLSGVTAPVDVVLGRLAAGEPLSTEQRAFYAAWVLNAEVCNGGFAQYFVNSSGATAGDAVTAFEAIGAPVRAELVRRAMALFGPVGVAVDHDERHEQLADLTPAGDAELDRLSTAYYDAPGDVPTLLTAFAGRQPAHFGGRA